LSSKDNLTLKLFTLNKMPEPDLLKLSPPSLNTLVKKLYYIIVLTDEAELKKKINSNIGEQNIVKRKRLKG
jgi:hypothetical protein